MRGGGKARVRRRARRARERVSARAELSAHALLRYEKGRHWGTRRLTRGKAARTGAQRDEEGLVGEDARLHKKRKLGEESWKQNQKRARFRQQVTHSLSARNYCP